MNILVSACLLGCACRYDGKSRPHPEVQALQGRYQMIPVCPEQMGGLPTPRPASERKNGRVVNVQGEDVTAQYSRGAEEALHLARFFHCPCAILKERSPACGSGEIYDGTFSGRLVPGDGAASELLKKNDISVYGESRISDMMEEYPAE